MREAGYSEASAKNPQKLTESSAWKELLDKAMPDKKLVSVHKKLLNAQHKLKRELGAHRHETRERQVIVEKKDKIKAAIGHSPDFADNLLAAWCGRTYKPSVGFRVRTA
jgi:phage terminase small subunit